MSSSLANNSYYAVGVNGNVKRSLNFGELKNPTPRPSVPPFINVDFKLSQVVSVPSEANPHVAQGMIQGTSESSIVIPSDDSVESLYITRRTEAEALTAMGVPASVHSGIIDSIAGKAASLIASARPRVPPYEGFVEVPVTAMSISVQIHHIFQSTIVDDVYQNNNARPASKSAIRILERGRRLGLEDATCTICLDDIGSNSEFLRMPCKHVFHVDCIEKWLSRSYFCPTCRYHMPVDN